jgi:inner membrane protein involved in colicin E2 resistance
MSAAWPSRGILAVMDHPSGHGRSALPPLIVIGFALLLFATALLALSNIAGWRVLIIAAIVCAVVASATIAVAVQVSKTRGGT